MPALSPELLVLLVVVVIAIVLLSRVNLAPKMRCNRCDGTGQVNEKWPDPTQPGGWHRVEGTCPKCKGKGRI